MGNQLERFTHLNYSELPTGDPSSVSSAVGLVEKGEELRVGVAYFFSDEDDDEVDNVRTTATTANTTTPTSERQVGSFTKEHMMEQQEQEEEEDDDEETFQEVQYSAFCSQECIFSKLQDHQDLQVYPARTLLTMCKPGDLLELLASDQPPHWAVYQHQDQVIHLHRGEIRRDSLFDVSAGRRGRIANNRYRYGALPRDLVLANAAGHLGLRGADVCWSDSESFAAWCRFGKREFKAGGESLTTALTKDVDRGRYFLKVHLGGASVHTLLFHRLEDMIRERRRLDARSGILNELQLVNADLTE